jgi:hypothetical protein
VVTLVRYVRCPGGCEGGEVWAGDLVVCGVCGGNAMVPVGCGGAFLERSVPFPVPEEPSLTEYRNDLRHYIGTDVSDDGRARATDQRPTEGSDG